MLFSLYAGRRGTNESDGRQSWGLLYRLAYDPEDSSHEITLSLGGKPSILSHSLRRFILVTKER